jgi:DNA (cytosine-5)-methyltransferase 1
MLVDLFAGGGGASVGIRQALGRDPDLAINHDRVAVAMHRANHPRTKHLQQDIWEVDPRWACRGKDVELLWVSPDCTHHSKAKGGPPVRDIKRRSLAWVVEKWILGVRPRIIMLENVEEFKNWGPLNGNGEIVQKHNGDIFRAFCKMFRRYGYSVDWRELRACDYGAPTIRKRLFLIARCDGQPIAWPDPTHGDGRRPYRATEDIIDWSLPCPSIFERKKPLAKNTMRRIFEGIRRYVIEDPEPFIVSYYGPKTRGSGFRGCGIDAPLPTQSTENRFGLVVPTLIQTGYGERMGQAPRVPGLGKPLGTVVAGGSKHAVVAAHLSKYYSREIGHGVNQPAGTVTTVDHHALVTSHLLKLRGTCRAGQAVTEPAPTVTSGGLHIGEVRAFLLKYYGTDQDPRLREPLHTLTTQDRFGLVTVRGEPYAIADIGMRMLQPHELFAAQGFPSDYLIDITNPETGRPISKKDKVRLVGNSVCPPNARVLIDANIKHTASEETKVA